MTFTPVHKPAGTPDGGQFTAIARTEPDLTLPAASEDEAERRNREFWEQAAADSAERSERIRQHEAARLDRLAAGGVEDEPETYEYVPEAVPPVHTGMFHRAFAALGSFSSSVEQRHERDMAEIAALSSGRSMLPRFLRRK